MSTNDQTDPHGPPIRLPVWRLVKASLSAVFLHPGNFAARIWPWVAIIASLDTSIRIILHGTIEDDRAAIILEVTLFPGTVMIAVSWHRGLLLGEAGGAQSAFRLDRSFGQFVWMLIRVFLIAAACVAVPIALPGKVIADMTSQEAINEISSRLGTIVGVFLAARLLLALPMAAIGARMPPLRGSWRMTRDNFVRLLSALLILLALSTILQYCLIYAPALGLLILGIDPLNQTPLILVGIEVLDRSFWAISVLLHAALGASLASYAYAVLASHPLGREVTR